MFDELLRRERDPEVIRWLIRQAGPFRTVRPIEDTPVDRRLL